MIDYTNLANCLDWRRNPLPPPPREPTSCDDSTWAGNPPMTPLKNVNVKAMIEDICHLEHPDQPDPPPPEYSAWTPSRSGVAPAPPCSEQAPAQQLPQHPSPIMPMPPEPKTVHPAAQSMAYPAVAGESCH